MCADLERAKHLSKAEHTEAWLPVLSGYSGASRQRKPRGGIRSISTQLRALLPSAQNPRGPLAPSHSILDPPAYEEAQDRTLPGGAGFSEANLRTSRAHLHSLSLTMVPSSLFPWRPDAF